MELMRWLGGSRRTTAVVLSLVALCGARGPAVAEAPRAGEVTLALKDYLDLLQTVEQREHERQERERRREPDVAEVAAQRIAVTIDGELASIEQVFEVVVDGAPRRPVVLPRAALASETRVERLGGPRGPDGAGGQRAADAAGASLDGVDGDPGSARLVVTAPGRYRVTLRGRAPLPLVAGARTLPLAAVLAPVAEATIDLPADADWNCPGGVPVEETASGARRHVRLALPRGADPKFAMRRKGDTAEAEQLLAQSVTLTLFQLLPDGPRRFDIVLYDVARGGLAALDVDLPAGVVPDSVITDEGEALAAQEGRHLRVERRKQLRGTGYLLVVSTPTGQPQDRLAIGALAPAVETRARYVVLASAVAAEARPLPEASWTRVDLDDLPPTLRGAVGGLDLLAAWRATVAETAAESLADAALAIAAPAPAPRLETLVRRRETTTLLSPDRTLLYRDRFTLAQAGEALRITLPPGARLWSVHAGGAAVTPLVEGGDLVVPLALAAQAGADAEVEVVSVADQAVPPGRSRLELAAPRVHAPVLEHEWRLLLPENARYRFAAGDLRPARGAAPAVTWAVLGAMEPVNSPGVLRDRVNVGGNEAGQVPANAGSLEIHVADDKGMVLPGVTLSLTPAGGAAVQAVGDANGVVVLPLSAGPYSLVAELEGFSTVQWSNIEVVAGRRTRLDVVLPAAAEDVITVTAESPVLDERRSGPVTSLGGNGLAEGYRFGRKDKQEAREEVTAAALFKQQAQALRQGLVGGVTPLAVTIPESGKAILLSGLLPPDSVSVAIDVKARK